MKRATQMTKRLALLCTAFCVCSSVAWDSPNSRKENSVTSLNYSQDTARTRVEIGVLDDPTFSVYALKNPERVVVERLRIVEEDQPDSSPKWRRRYGNRQHVAIRRLSRLPRHFRAR